MLNVAALAVNVDVIDNENEDDDDYKLGKVEQNKSDQSPTTATQERVNNGDDENKDDKIQINKGMRGDFHSTI